LALLLTLLLVTVWTSRGFAGTFVAFGPETFPRSTGEPIPFARSFSVLNPSTQYAIQVQVVGVPSATISINGVPVIQPSDFDMNVALIERPVLLQASNLLSGEVRGKPDGTITVQIIGVDNDLPTISATANPPANTNGWNNTDVTVSFTADDRTSGIASVTPPVTVTTQGANQTVTGTASDRAGNSATASVNISIDKTPPSLAIASPADGTFLRASSVTVTGSAADALSGTENVLCNGTPASLSGSEFSCAVALVEGTNSILVEALDRAGNPASSAITVIMDMTPPSVLITSPANGTTVSASPVVVTGTATDALSGTARVACNGAPATLSGSDFTCEVPLAAGPNTIVVAATDGAGNSASQSITVTLGGMPTPPPNAILITPSTLALVVDEPRELALVDDYGRPVAGATWSLSDATLAEISTQVPVVLTGKAAGELTVTATWQNFSAQAQVTVFAGPELPQGTIRWSVQPTPGYSTAQIAQAQPVENMPDIYSVEDGGASGVIVRALTSDGRQRWLSHLGGSQAASAGAAAAAALPATQQAPSNGTFIKAFADTYGGILLLYEEEDPPRSVIVRLDGATGLQSWRNDSVGWLWYDWAFHPDGTVYMAEGFAVLDPYGYYVLGPESNLLALDGMTGAARFRIPLPASRYLSLYSKCDGSDYEEIDILPGAPAVAPDGAVYMEMEADNDIGDPAPCDTMGLATFDHTLRLLQVQPDGTATWRTLKRYTYEGPWDRQSFMVPYARPGEVIPDGQGGLLAGWSHHVAEHFSNLLPEARVTHLANGSEAEYTLSQKGWGGSRWAPPNNRTMVLGEDGVAFALTANPAAVHDVSPNTVVAFDVASGAVRWTWQAAADEAELVAATAGGGLVVKDGTRLARLDANGQATYDDWLNGAPPPGTPASIDPATIVSLDYNVGHQWLAITHSSDSTLRSVWARIIDWAWSIWPSPSVEETRASIAPIKVNVFKILEANVEDAFVRSNVNTAIAYWQMYARILLDWNGSITPQFGCDPPQGVPDNCAAPYDVYDLTVFKGNKNDNRAGSEAVRRFASSRGVNYLFVQGFADTASPPDPNIALATHGITPIYTDSQGSWYRNLTIIRSQNVGQVVPAHETGHQLQLFHVTPIWGLGNLMCGAEGNLLDWLAYAVPWDCSPTDSNKLTDAQIDKARDAATVLKGPVN
jgi:uncharacterized Zn-binding protein involved in type VI secretion